MSSFRNTDLVADRRAVEVVHLPGPHVGGGAPAALPARGGQHLRDGPLHLVAAAVAARPDGDPSDTRRCPQRHPQPLLAAAGMPVVLVPGAAVLEAVPIVEEPFVGGVGGVALGGDGDGGVGDGQQHVGRADASGTACVYPCTMNESVKVCGGAI